MLAKIKKFKLYLLFALMSSLFISACMYMNSERVSSTTSTSTDKPQTPTKSVSASASKQPTKKPAVTLSTQSSMSNFAPQKSLQTLKNKIEAGKDFRVRIFGDSHMAADFFSRELRKVLLDVNAAKNAHSKLFIFLNFFPQGFKFFF